MITFFLNCVNFWFVVIGKALLALIALLVVLSALILIAYIIVVALYYILTFIACAVIWIIAKVKGRVK